MTFSFYCSFFVLLVHLFVSRIGFLISQSQILVFAIRSGIEIGIFNADCEVRFPTTISQKSNSTFYFCSLDISFVMSLLMLLVCGDTKLNPGPRKHDTCYNSSICCCQLWKGKSSRGLWYSQQIWYNLFIRNVSWFL